MALHEREREREIKRERDEKETRRTGSVCFHPPVKLAVFVSGAGSNLSALITSCAGGDLRGLATIVLVVSSAPGAPALEIAQEAGIDTFVRPKNIALAEILHVLERHAVDMILLAGYLRLVEPELVAHYRERIMNIHPTLLPKFGGKGMYGLKAHESVLAAGETKSGATVHLVDERYDSGPIVAQAETAVLPSDTPLQLAERVRQLEHQLYPNAIASYIRSHCAI